MKSHGLAIILILPTFAVADDAKQSVNLLQNPSIEDGDDRPAHWKEGNSIPGVERSWEKVGSFKGQACLCIKISANRYFPIAVWTQTIDHTSDFPVFNVSAHVKAEDATKAILDVLFLDADREWISHEWIAYIGSKEAGDPPANHDWKQYSGSVKVPPKTEKIVVGLQGYGPGTVWFDEIAA